MLKICEIKRSKLNFAVAQPEIFFEPCSGRLFFRALPALSLIIFKNPVAFNLFLTFDQF